MRVCITSLSHRPRRTWRPAVLAVTAFLIAAAPGLRAQQTGPDEGDEKAAESARGLQREAEKHLRAGKAVEAQAAYRKAVAVQEKLARNFPGVAEYRFDLASSHVSLGGVLLQTGRLKEAEAGTRRAVALLERLVAEFPTLGPYRQELARAYEHLGQVLRATGRANEADAILRRAEQIRKGTEKGPK
jgi:tetratricopeptide (TPR) repeat protein